MNPATSPGDASSAREPGRGVARYRWLLATLVAVWALAYLPWLGVLDLQFEEPRRVLVAQAMLETGEYWVPQLAGEPYTAKPPMFNWLLAASAAAHGGFGEWSARLPSTLCVLGLALAFVAGARRRLGLPALAFLGAALVLSPEILAKGRLAEIEPLFALLVAASLWSWILLDTSGVRGAKRWVPALALVALAYLTKREPAVVFFYFAVGPYLLLRGRWRELFEPGHFAGIAVAGLIVGGWLYGMAAATSWTELWVTFRTEVLERGLAEQGAGDVLVHLVTYPLSVFAAMLPFSALLPLLAVGEVRRRVTARFGDLFVFSVVAVAANLPVYWFRGDVAVRYFLPMFPFALLVAAMVFDVLADGFAEMRAGVRRYLTASGWTLGVLAALFAVVVLVSAALPRYVDGHEALLPAALTVLIALAGAAVLPPIRRWSRRAPLAAWLAASVAVVVLGRVVYFNVALADRVVRYAEDRNAPRIAAGLVDAVGAGTPVHAHRVNLAIWYYADAVDMTALDPSMPPPPGSWVLALEDAGASPFDLRDARHFRYRDEVYVLGRL